MLHLRLRPEKNSVFKQKALWSFLSLLAAWMFFFWPSVYSIFGGDTSWVLWSTYGITLASFYLIYAQRHELENTLFVSSQLGLIALFLLAIGFILGGITHLQYVEQSALMLMLPAIVMTALGPAVIRTLYVPLLYLMLIIPLQDDQLQHRSAIIWAAVGAFFLYWRFLTIHKPAPAIIDTTPAWVFQNSRWLVPTGIAFGILMVVPWLGDNIRSFYPEKHREIALRAPLGDGGWTGPIPIKRRVWTPLYQNASATIQSEYLPRSRNEEDSVYLYSAYYYSDRSFVDLLDPRNFICDPAVWHKNDPKTITVNLGASGSIPMIESIVRAGAVSRLVWSWYYIAGVDTVDLGLANLLDNVRVISKYAQGTGIMLVSTSYNLDPEEARNRLREFLTVMYDSLDVLKRPEIMYTQATQKGT